MKKFFILLTFILFLFPSYVFGSYVVSRTSTTNDTVYTGVQKNDNWLERVQLVVWDWESGSGGSCSGGAVTGVTGRLEHVIFIPGTGSRTPSNLYDVTVYTAASANEDLLQTIGINCSSTATNRWTPLDTKNDTYVWAMNDTLYLSVTHAGNKNRGTVILIFTLP